MIHDRVTGAHVTTEPDTVFQDGVEKCCALLNALNDALHDARPMVQHWCHTQGDNAEWHAETLAPINAALGDGTKQAEVEK